MKSWRTKGLGIVALLLASPAMAGAVTPQTLPGIYVAKLDREETYFQAEIRISPDGRYTFRAKTEDEEAPPSYCSGRWTMEAGLFQGRLICGEGRDAKAILQQLNLADVSDEKLRSSEGARVEVRSSVIPASWGPIYFRFWRIEQDRFVSH